jgi:hypothetical protein
MRILTLHRLGRGRRLPDNRSLPLSEQLVQRRPLRCISVICVPAVYLTSAFVAILAVLYEHRMNSLRVFNGLDGSIPTAPTKIPMF